MSVEERLRDVDTTQDGEPFLVMELLEGESLARKLKKGRVELEEGLRLIAEQTVFAYACSTAANGPGERIGKYEIIRELGRGGMGIVFEAEQQSLARRVAVKVLPKQALLDDKHLRRFEREARIFTISNITRNVSSGRTGRIRRHGQDCPTCRG